MALTIILEFLGQRKGWRAACTLEDGRVVSISAAQSPQTARRRMKRKLAAEGIVDPEFTEKLRIPAHLEAQVTSYRKKEQARTKLDREIQKIRPRLAQQLLTELNLTEREVAAWLGVSHTLISTLLLAHTADTQPTGEIDLSEKTGDSGVRKTSAK